MSYESPIRVFIDDVVDALATALENGLIEATLHYGVAVDKAELIKALEYDRDQYEKGYADGQKDAVKHGHWILEREPDGKPYCYHCSVCDNDFRRIGIMSATDYCPNCGARMDEEE